ncbi:hypothetical protein LOK49_LG08G02375 [Camellia lanceoleosa]|uniref:Uncharacterized protein n=1 Tax=Camellia lanceoleosa TaxID=1840588 RepID=A0ACC0GVC3_9ERIC|nr:hypothetical protein LOK49_LG08G02375 [Camellia lanceoleosa]
MSGMGAGNGPQSEDQKPNMADQSQSNQLNIKVKNQNWRTDCWLDLMQHHKEENCYHGRVC